jgi:preprotein translocase subunit SecG
VTTLLITVHVLACIVLILSVLLQAGRGADMGAAFGGASTPMFGSGSASNPLARMTTITAVAFLTTALLLAVASARRASVFDGTPEPLAVTPRAESSAPAAEVPPAPVAEAQPLTIPAAPAAAPAEAPAAGNEAMQKAEVVGEAPAAAPVEIPVEIPVPAAAPSAEAESAPAAKEAVPAEVPPAQP